MKKKYSILKQFYFPSILSKIIGVTILMIFTANQVNAQSKKGKFIDLSIGYGISFPFEEVDIMGSGFYTQGEYVINLSKWIGIRPYAGLILTKAVKNENQQNQVEYKVTSNALLVGGKVRIVIPIPWVAPYFETGIGASLGSFETHTPHTNIKENGFSLHIPFSLGLQIGRNHNFNIEFTYYFQPYAEQIIGATAFGISLPLNKN